jgi:hypothetical protein
MCNSSNPIAAELTSAFISMSGLKGVSAGQRFCLEASSWKKAADKGDDVPRVTLASSHEAALKTVDLEVLKKWEMRDNAHTHGAARPKEGGSDGFTRESKEIGGKKPKA